MKKNVLIFGGIGIFILLVVIAFNMGTKYMDKDSIVIDIEDGDTIDLGEGDSEFSIKEDTINENDDEDGGEDTEDVINMEFDDTGNLVVINEDSKSGQSPAEEEDSMKK